ncbi:MAG: nucleotidyl transferase AbiEii/AbiGii toxin family protein [Phycisphaeraceae bacterium]
MNDLTRLLKRVAADLDRLDIRWALVGGMAVSARTKPRFTHDLDFAIAVASDAEAEAVIRSLVTESYQMPQVFEQTRAGRLGIVRMKAPYDREYFVDLIFASSGVEPELIEAATPLRVAPGLNVPVAPIPHLIAMKTLSVSRRRRQDRIDLEILIETATSEELNDARRLVALIVERGYQQSVDLKRRLARLIAGCQKK